MSSPHLEVLGPDVTSADRPPLLFVHGLGHEAHCWDHWRAAAAEAGFPAYALSLRGHGNSQGSSLTGRLGQYREDVLRVARSLPAPPVLIGHSMGGLVVAQALARYRAPAAVLVAAVPARPALGSLLSIARRHPGDAARVLVGASLPLRPEYMFEKLAGPEVDAHIARCGRESAIAQFQLLFHRRPRPLPGTPILMLGARADRLVPIRDVRASARHYDAELMEFGGIGHNLMQDVGREAPWHAARAWLDRVLDPVRETPRLGV